MQQIADRDMGNNDGNDLGIVTYLGTTSSPPDEAAVTTEAADPLQQRGPWGNSQLPRSAGQDFVPTLLTDDNQQCIALGAV